METRRSKSNPIKKLVGDISPSKLSRMRTASRPINPRNTPIRIQLREQDVHQCRNVMFVDVTRRETILLKNRVVFAVRHNVDGELTVHLKPLRPFSPICNGYCGKHFGVISATAWLPWVVKAAYEALF
jgi:hypothetical protein